MDIGKALNLIDQRLKALERSSRLSHASIENTAIQVNDSSGGLRAILGVQSDGTTAANIVNGPPPPAPSAPIVASVLGGVTASWDGQLADGSVLPLDWSRVEVHASTSATYTPTAATLQDTIETAQGATVVVPSDTPVYVLLVARNTSGTASAPSAIVGPFGPTEVVPSNGTVTLNTLSGPLGDTASQRYADYFRDATAWQQLSVANGGSFTIDTTPVGTPSGGGRLIATGEVQVAGKALIPQDTDTLYRVMVRVRATAQDPTGAGTVFIGAVGVAQDGVTLVNRFGAAANNSQHYCCASGTTLGTADGWKTYVGWIQGHSADGATAPAGPANDPRAPEATHANVRYLRPMIWLNFSKSTAAVAEVEAVTVEAIRTGQVGSTNLLSGSVTAGAIAADAVTAGTVAADAITSREIAANSITTAKLQAGSVDATALSATAITGKTITGGTITGAVLQTATSGERITLNEGGANQVLLYNSSGAAIGELSSRGLLVKGTTGAVIWLNPQATYPQVTLYNAANTNKVIMQVVEPTTGEANLEMLSGSYTLGTYTDMRSRVYLAKSAAVIERLRADDPSHKRIGGRLFIGDTYGNLGFVNDDNTAQETGFTVEANLASVQNGRLYILPPASVNSALYVEADAAHTGNLARLYRNGVDQFKVDTNGNTNAAGILTAGNIASGRVTITPVPNTPTSAIVSGLTLKGSTVRVVATPVTGFPGTEVLGVGVSGPSTTGFTIWLTRSNNATTSVDWIAYAT